MVQSATLETNGDRYASSCKKFGLFPTNLGDSGAKLKPSESAPNSMAAHASSKFVIPQILTRVRSVICFQPSSKSPQIDTLLYLKLQLWERDGEVANSPA